MKNLAGHLHPCMAEVGEFPGDYAVCAQRTAARPLLQSAAAPATKGTHPMKRTFHKEIIINAALVVCSTVALVALVVVG